jgi:hypothetical protein
MTRPFRAEGEPPPAGKAAGVSLQAAGEQSAAAEAQAGRLTGGCPAPRGETRGPFRKGAAFCCFTCRRPVITGLHWGLTQIMPAVVPPTGVDCESGQARFSGARACSTVQRRSAWMPVVTKTEVAKIIPENIPNPRETATNGPLISPAPAAASDEADVLIRHHWITVMGIGAVSRGAALHLRGKLRRGVGRRAQDGTRRNNRAGTARVGDECLRLGHRKLPYGQ